MSVEDTYLNAMTALERQIGVLSKECERLRAELADYDDAYRQTMSEHCTGSPDDSRLHCTCVPPLVESNRRLRAELADLRSITFAGRPLAVEPVDESALREAIRGGYRKWVHTGGDVGEVSAEYVRPLLSRPVSRHPSWDDFRSAFTNRLADDTPSVLADIAVTVCNTFDNAHCAEPPKPEGGDDD